MLGNRERFDDLVEVAHDAFQASARRSLTSGLTRALLAVHTVLTQENPEAGDNEHCIASGVAVALRPSGLYVAQMGDGLFGNTRLGTLWARSWEADDAGLESMGEDGSVELLPRVTTEFFPVAPGDAFLLLPGLNGSEAAGEWLGGAFGSTPDLDSVGELLRNAAPTSCGLVVWWPENERSAFDHRWHSWPGAPTARQAATQEVPALPGSLPKPGLRARLPSGRPLIIGAASLALLLMLTIAGSIRNSSPDTTVDEAAALIRQAETAGDRDAAIGSLDQALARLQPRTERDQAALTLAKRAQANRDRMLDVVHVSEIERFPLPSGSEIHPLGLWKNESSLFVLDLGAQLLYRADSNGARVEVALKPGDTYADQPMGKLVSGAWSPPRGTDTDGRLLLIDTLRSIVSISTSGTRRWWPPDDDQWDKIGPTAATFDDLFVLDSGRGLIRQYPARVALARSTVAATVADEPKIAQALDLATDGNLYVLLPGGVIRKIAPGAGGLPFDGRVPGEGLKGAVALFAQADYDRVWVLDPPGSRVVELTTSGTYMRQYVFPPNVIRTGASLHVDPAKGDLRVLTSEHVLSVKMNTGIR